MPIIYELYVRHEVNQRLKKIRGKNREKIFRFIESLINDPFQSGDDIEIDRSGREYQVKIIGKYALYYWADHPVKEVKIVDLIDADKY